jgi:hypothetical protein
LTINKVEEYFGHEGHNQLKGLEEEGIEQIYDNTYFILQIIGICKVNPTRING